MTDHPPMPTDIGQMLDQPHWYKGSNGNWVRVLDMTESEKQIAHDRLINFALVFAQAAFKDLYSYGYPSGEQAQIDLERGEAECEAILSSKETAQQWMRQTELCAAMRGEKPYEDWEPPEDGETASAPPLRADEQMRTELAELDKAITRTESTLTYLRELRGRLA